MMDEQTLKTPHGTVETKPYVGDSDIVYAECIHGDYAKIFKGKTEQHAAKALAEHFAAKHKDEDQ